jgi:hypothetical protein
MSTHIVYAGDTWTFDTTLTDSVGDPITSLSDAWFSIFSDKTTEQASYELSDSEMTLASNVLTVVIPPATTSVIADGSYYLDVKIKESGGTVTTVTDRDRVRCINVSPLHDDY